MPTTPSYCTGCGKSFTSSGYWSHLTQSQNPSCQAVLEEQLTGVCSDSSCGDNSSCPSEYADSNFGQLDEDRVEGGDEKIESDESMDVDDESMGGGDESKEDEDQ